MTHEQLATDLLTPLWRGISPDYKRRYVFSVWPQFEDNLRSAAYTARLSTFLAKITQRLGIIIFTADAEKVALVIQCEEEKTVLRMLREETTLLVLLVRVANEERKEKYEKKHKKEEPNGDKNLRGYGTDTLFDQP